MQLFKYSFLVILFLFSMNIYSQDEIKFEAPILITSAGQSADVKLTKLLFDMQKLPATTIIMAKTSDLKDVKSLVIVPGFSSKGLGAAGVSVDDEIKRVEEIINTANKKRIPIILLHIGGKARRQGNSDNFIKMVANASKYMIVVKQGNEDNLFTDLSKSLNIPLEIVDKIPNAGAPIGKLFK